MKEGSIMIDEKLTSLREWMMENDVDVTYIHSPANIAYFTQFHSDPHERIMGLFIPKEGIPFLFTPALEVEAAKSSPWPYDVFGYVDGEDPFALIAQHLEVFGKIKDMALEKNTLPVDRLEALEHYLPNTTFKHSVSPLIADLKMYKNAEERQFMMEAGDLADIAFEIGFKAISEGVSEQEIVALIEYEMKKRGVPQMSFGTLVLAGAHAANPHGEPTTTIKIKPHELVLFDLGCMWKGYASDATRMASYKEPTDFQRKIFDIVREAQFRAQSAIKPGITAGELDAIARDYITKQGYGEYFIHRLGHGIGSEAHEEPSIVGGNDLIIKEGMCFSIEPGIYIPNEVGVRVEDCVYVTKDGSQAFTKSSKDLHIIK